MQLRNMFKKMTRATEEAKEVKIDIPEGLLKKCPKCHEGILAKEVKNANYTCPKCKGYFKLSAYRRLSMLVDERTFEEWSKDYVGENPLDFQDYESKLEEVREKTKLKEAVITGSGLIGGVKCAIAVMDGRFMMASMGHAVGEKITLMVERATKENLPIIMVTCSGGARMQEGLVSLMQMAKTSAALKRHSEAGGLYISVLTDPTTGGVMASFAMLGDIILAEPNALVGFAGRRVIEQTIGEKLPEGFQSSEFLLEHGFIDAIVKREDLKDTLAYLLRVHTGQPKDFVMPQKIETTTKDVGKLETEASLEDKAWNNVLASRSKNRPVGRHYVEHLVDEFMELHGDRQFKDDSAIIGGIGYLLGKPVTIIVQSKGKTTEENIKNNFGMPSPEGYRKALRLMKQAEKFHRPVICLVDTPGAFCGVEAEERGQGEAIARNLYELSSINVPILSIVIGEGGSGGALAMAVADEVWMLEKSIYSILSPEGFASILWRDAKRAKEAAVQMRLSAREILSMNIIEKVIEEPAEYSIENIDFVINSLLHNIHCFLETYTSLPKEELLERRYQRFRRI